VPEIPWPDPWLRDGAILLRPWTRDDLPAIVAACQDPAVSRFSPHIPYPYGPADGLGWLESREPVRLSGEGIGFAIVDARSDELLGAIGVAGIDRLLGIARIGYWLAAQARGRGYATTALRLVAGWAFDGLGFARLELTTDPENVRSQRVAERCGFRREGHLRSHMLIRHSGERRDSLIYGLLPGELT
jgi:RimJ/RimL family protein N-acetyltransferase